MNGRSMMSFILVSAPFLFPAAPRVSKRAAPRTLTERGSRAGTTPTGTRECTYYIVCMYCATILLSSFFRADSWRLSVGSLPEGAAVAHARYASFAPPQIQILPPSACFQTRKQCFGVVTTYFHDATIAQSHASPSRSENECCMPDCRVRGTGQGEDW